MLESCAVEKPDAWSDYVGRVLRTYNSVLSHRTTKMVPDVVFFISCTDSAEDAIKQGLDNETYQKAVRKHSGYQSLKLECDYVVKV